MTLAGRLHRLSVATAVSAVAAACAAPAEPSIELVAPDEGSAFVEVRGLPRDVLRSLDRSTLSDDQWADVLRVAVAPGAPAMLGTYEVTARSLRFTPLFPLDPGRSYDVTFDASRVPGAARGVLPALVAAVGHPAVASAPSTSVAHVYPSGDTVPENMLRMYVEFTAPMGRRSGVEYITLLDHAGREIEGAVLPLDYEFWSPDHRRFTVFFDPGRVKSGILPNRDEGRPLETGTAVTLVISREWRDAHGLPLVDEYRRVFRVGPADEAPLDTASWHIQPPSPGGREPLVVLFPKPLDHGLLMRAMGVRQNGRPINGDIAVEAGETRWTFTPGEPWRAGAYQLLALDILEDLAGNQIGRAFEVDNFDTVDKSPDPQTIEIPFRIG